MRVNSDETLRRAAAYRAANSGSSWLELSRRPDQQRNSREFFSGGRADAEPDRERPSQIDG